MLDSIITIVDTFITSILCIIITGSKHTGQALHDERYSLSLFSSLILREGFKNSSSVN